MTEFDFTGTVTIGGTTATFQGLLAPVERVPAQRRSRAWGDFFEVSSFFDIFTELSIDGGPFSPPVEHVVTLEAVPEPSAILLLLTGFGGVPLAAGLEDDKPGVLPRDNGQQRPGWAN